MIAVDGDEEPWEMGEPMRGTGEALKAGGEALMAVDGKLMVMKSRGRWGGPRRWAEGS